ncbi:hypothetical protein HHK36_026484 [Tetracentron sinense]|uniref:Uncharacterized protein n=1 Tax=Tetracentron sinense TaxID=13715 RepID=A0A835D283_TETSI|nr:hypothetical protein HHK36_026484 [Tetracentron sinense]
MTQAKGIPTEFHPINCQKVSDGNPGDSQRAEDWGLMLAPQVLSEGLRGSSDEIEGDGCLNIDTNLGSSVVCEQIQENVEEFNFSKPIREENSESLEDLISTRLRKLKGRFDCALLACSYAPSGSITSYQRDVRQHTSPLVEPAPGNPNVDGVCLEACEEGHDSFRLLVFGPHSPTSLFSPDFEPIGCDDRAPNGSVGSVGEKGFGCDLVDSCSSMSRKKKKKKKKKKLMTRKKCPDKAAEPSAGGLLEDRFGGLEDERVPLEDASVENVIADPKSEGEDFVPLNPRLSGYRSPSPLLSHHKPRIPQKVGDYVSPCDKDPCLRWYGEISQWPAGICKETQGLKCCKPLTGEPAQEDFNLKGLYPSDKSGIYITGCNSCPFYPNEVLSHPALFLARPSPLSILIFFFFFACAGITPTEKHEQDYSVTKIKEAIKTETKVNAYIECSSRVLSDYELLNIYFCIDKDATTIIECPVAPPGSPFNCPGYIEFSTYKFKDTDANPIRMSVPQ